MHRASRRVVGLGETEVERSVRVNWGQIPIVFATKEPWALLFLLHQKVLDRLGLEWLWISFMICCYNINASHGK
jgi:hypothetical protein